MKITIEVDCTPAEARAMIGLPDLAPIQERYVADLAAMTQGRLTPEMVEALFRQWGSLGETGAGMWRALLAGADGGGRTP